MTKYPSLDSNKNSVIFPLELDLVTKVTGCDSGQSLKAGVRASEKYIYAHVS